MPMKKLIIVFAILLTSLSFAASFPQPVGFVNDFAHILTNGPQLEHTLNDYEKNTTIEIAVVTIESLPADQTAATYAVELFQDWGIGKKGEDNGILVLIIKNGTVGNRLRIELGYGIQGYVTGAESGRILDEALPYYQRGDYDSTANIIVDGLKDQLLNYVPGKFVQNNGIFGSIEYEFLPFFVILFFVIIPAASIIMRNRCPYCIRGKLECKNGVCVCQRCGRRVSKKMHYALVIAGVGSSSGGSGGGFGGFGGGGSGGGGAGR